MQQPGCVNLGVSLQRKAQLLRDPRPPHHFPRGGTGRQPAPAPFLKLVNRRYEVGSTILTSNQSFEEWGHILADGVMATALIDRLLYHCQMVDIRGNSYRRSQHTELLTALQDHAATTEAETSR